MKRILVIGGYGNFGTHITKKLTQNKDLRVIICGRLREKCAALAAQLANNPSPPEFYTADIQDDTLTHLTTVKPDIVIHTSGPFQTQGYAIAEACIAFGCHYIDLADGRDFVAGIDRLDAQARAAGVAIISGASSVPTLTSAVINHYLPQFAKLKHIDYGITTAQRTNTGLATTKAVLGYCGKPFATIINGVKQNIYGWQGMALRKYPELGYRLLGNCDVPDLALFPARYPTLETIRFRAGLEISLIHISLWTLSWLVRAKLVKTLEPAADAMLRLSRLFDPIGSDRSAFHMELSGVGHDRRALQKTFYMIAGSGHGPYIPSIPSILCAEMLARGGITRTGAYACMDIITLDMYVKAMHDLDIKAVHQA